MVLNKGLSFVPTATDAKPMEIMKDSTSLQINQKENSEE